MRRTREKFPDFSRSPTKILRF